MVNNQGSQLVWQLVKNYNCFMHKGLNGVVLSKEPGNLYNLHNYKYSGLANEKTIHIEEDKDNDAIKVTKLKKGTTNTPRKSGHTSTTKRHVRRATAGLAKQTQGYRPDLKKAALARASAVGKSIRVRKAAAKSA
jgi:large subunit ribosomal protein L28e